MFKITEDKLSALEAQNQHFDFNKFYEKLKKLPPNFMPEFWSLEELAAFSCNISSSQQASLIYFAALGGNSLLVQQLIDSNLVHLTAPNEQGLYPSVCACISGNQKTLSIIEHHLTQEEIIRQVGNLAALDLAIYGESIPLVDHLIETYIIDFSQITSGGYTVLYTAVLTNNAELVDYFISKRKLSYIFPNQPTTALHIAILMKKSRVTFKLIDQNKGNNEIVSNASYYAVAPLLEKVLQSDRDYNDAYVFLAHVSLKDDCSKALNAIAQINIERLSEPALIQLRTVLLNICALAIYFAKNFIEYYALRLAGETNLSLLKAMPIPINSEELSSLENLINIFTTNTNSEIEFYTLKEALQGMIGYLSRNMLLLKQFDDGEGLLHFAATAGHAETIKILKQIGLTHNLPSLNNDTPLLRTLDNKGTNLVKTILHGDMCISELSDLALKDDAVGAQTYLEENSNAFCFHDLECIFLSAVNNHFFKSAMVIFSFIQRAKCSSEVSYTPPVAIARQPMSWEEKKFIFPAEMQPPRQDAIKDALSQISSLLVDSDKCLTLLHDLDRELSASTPSTSDVSNLTPGALIDFHAGLFLPSDFSQATYSTAGILRKTLIKKLREHGIHQGDEGYIFSGFVDTETANQLVIDGQLFKEQFLMGNSLIHGTISHFIQWYIIILAYEQGEITLPDELTPQELLKATVEVKYDNAPVWVHLIDSIINKHNAEHYYLRKDDFSSPHRLNSTLLLTEELPFLRGYLLNSWYKNIRKFQKYFLEVFNVEIPYECIVCGQAISHGVFNKFDIGFNNQHVETYYRTRAATGDHSKLNQATGILVKSKQTSSFSLFASEHQQESTTRIDPVNTIISAAENYLSVVYKDKRPSKYGFGGSLFHSRAGFDRANSLIKFLRGDNESECLCKAKTDKILEACELSSDNNSSLKSFIYDQLEVSTQSELEEHLKSLEAPRHKK